MRAKSTCKDVNDPTDSHIACICSCSTRSRVSFSYRGLDLRHERLYCTLSLYSQTRGVTRSLYSQTRSLSGLRQEPRTRPRTRASTLSLSQTRSLTSQTRSLSDTLSLSDTHSLSCHVSWAMEAGAGGSGATCAVKGLRTKGILKLLDAL